MTKKSFSKFEETYLKPGNVLLDVDIPKHEDTPSFIIIRHGKFTLVLNPIALGDHLCVDAHAFVDGEDATSGVMGVTDGRRLTLEETGTTSHGWNSAPTVGLMVGEQVKLRELTWENAGHHYEPQDQTATSFVRRGDDRGFWSLGPARGDSWSVELIMQNVHLEETFGVDLGSFPTEAAAKEAAQKYEDTHH